MVTSFYQKCGDMSFFVPVLFLRKILYLIIVSYEVLRKLLTNKYNYIRYQGFTIKANIYNYRIYSRFVQKFTPLKFP